MNCQNCFRPATVHVTEISGNSTCDLHFCAEHAKEYVAPERKVSVDPGELLDASRFRRWNLPPR